MIESKLGQRMLGAFIMIIGIGLTSWNWYDLIQNGIYRMKLALLGPLFAVLALGPSCFPYDMPAFREKFGTDKPQKWEHFPLVWKLIVVLSVLAGLGNLAAMSMYAN